MKTAQVVITESGKMIQDPDKGLIVLGSIRKAEAATDDDEFPGVLLRADAEMAFTKTELVEKLGYTAKELRAAAVTISKKERASAKKG